MITNSNFSVSVWCLLTLFPSFEAAASVKGLGRKNLAFKYVSCEEAVNGLVETDTNGRQYVIFRLCEKDNEECTANGFTDSYYGEYMIHLETYFNVMLPYHQQRQAAYCANYPSPQDHHYEACQTPHFAEDRLDYWKEIGFNTSIFPECQPIVDNLPEEPNFRSAGPMCPHQGSGRARIITVGRFQDAECKKGGEEWVCDLTEFDFPFFDLIYYRISDVNYLVDCEEEEEICDELYQGAEAKCEPGTKKEGANDACRLIKKSLPVSASPTPAPKRATIAPSQIKPHQESYESFYTVPDDMAGRGRTRWVIDAASGTVYIAMGILVAATAYVMKSDARRKMQDSLTKVNVRLFN